MIRHAGGPTWDRRAFVRGAAGIVAASALGLPARRADAGEAQVTRINERTSVIGGLGGNVLVHAAGPELVLVDGGSGGQSDKLVEALAGLAPSGHVGLLFNSHWHEDQVGANAALRGQGARIVAHAKTYAHLAVPNYLPDEDRYRPALPEEALPTETFYTGAAIETDGGRISYGYLLEAHTDGDIYVRFEPDNVIATGGAISPSRDPEFDWYGGGWLGGRIDSLELLLSMSDASTAFVPSDGPVVDRAYVESEHELMLGLYDILWERMRAGESAADILASGALDKLSRQFDDPRKLLYDAQKSMWAHYNTLSPDIV